MLNLIPRQSCFQDKAWGSEMKHPVLKLIFLPNPDIFQPLHNFFPFVLACLSSLFLFPISFNQNLLFLPLSVLGKIFVTLILP